MKAMIENDHPQKISRYLEAGSPLCCFLPACRKPFLGSCVRGNDGQFYYSHVCADECERSGLSQVAKLKAKR
jgi:hypothetical protein